jgi:hypothetical protein
LLFLFILILFLILILIFLVLSGRPRAKGPIDRRLLIL